MVRIVGKMVRIGSVWRSLFGRTLLVGRQDFFDTCWSVGLVDLCNELLQLLVLAAIAEQVLQIFFILIVVAVIQARCQILREIERDEESLSLLVT